VIYSPQSVVGTVLRHCLSNSCARFQDALNGHPGGFDGQPAWPSSEAVQYPGATLKLQNSTRTERRCWNGAEVGDVEVEVEVEVRSGPMPFRREH